MNVIVYAISLRSGGGYSVLSDFYNEITQNAEKYSDINWLFLLSTQEFAQAENVKIINAQWSIRSFFHRAYFNLVTIKKLIKENDISAIVSLQNMGVMGSGKPNLVCLHNVLPLYKCDKNVLDSFKQRIKQYAVNKGIILSLKKAYRVFVASEWIKDEIMHRFGVDAERIVVSKLGIPEYVPIDEVQPCSKTTFFYPAGPLPYKNYRVIVDACKILRREKIDDFEVQLTFSKEQGKTAASIYNEVTQETLNIVLTGILPREEVLRSYCNKVLLFPSKIENDAMPLIECMQYKGYALAADLPYARDVLDQYPGKKYFDPDDAEALASQMKKLIVEGVPQFDYDSDEHELGEGSRVEKVVQVLRDM